MEIPEFDSRFLAKVRLPNGTWKTTYPNRLDDLNERLLDFLPRDGSLDVMDVAVSSGVSTLEWTEYLTASGIQHRLVAGDLDTDAWLATWGDRFAVLFDSTRREPLLVEVGSAMLPVHSDRRLARVTRPLLSPLLRATAGRRSRPVSLVIAELRRRPEVEIVQDDVTAPGRFPQAFDVIRAANLVQRAYFDEDTLRSVVANLRDRLRDGGVLVICRTAEDGVNHATIFRRSGDHFSSEASIGDGAEVRDLVLAL